MVRSFFLFGAFFVLLFGSPSALTAQEAPQERSPEEDPAAPVEGDGVPAEPAAPAEGEAAAVEAPAEPEPPVPAPIPLHPLTEAREQHQVRIGRNGWADLFLSDRARVRVCSHFENGAEFGYHGGFPESRGYALSLARGMLHLFLGDDPLRIGLPGLDVVVAGPGTEVTVSLEEGLPTFSRVGNGEGAQTLYVQGRAEEIPAGGWVKLGANGLGESAPERDLPALTAAPSMTETFHYVTGADGGGEVALGGGSRLRLGASADVLLAANRTPVPPFFLAQVRDGDLVLQARDADGLLVNTPWYRLVFAPEAEAPAGEDESAGEAPEAPPGDAPDEGAPAEGGEGTPGEEPGGEEPPAGGDGGEGESALPGGPVRVRGPLVAVAQDEAVAGLHVQITSAGMVLSNGSGREVEAVNLVQWSKVAGVKIPAGGELVVQMDTASHGVALVNSGSTEIRVRLEGSDEWIVIAPFSSLSVDEGGNAQQSPLSAEEIARLRSGVSSARPIAEAIVPVPPELPETPEGPPPTPGTIDVGSIIPPTETSFRDPGFIEEQQEASPFLP